MKLLSRQESVDSLLFAVAVVMAMWLLPDHAIDRYGVINPWLIGRLTLIVMALNAFGYIAARTLGAGRGLLLAGLFGGFVSSAATIAAMGQRARAEPDLNRVAVAGAMLSSVSTVIQLAIILAVTWRPLLVHMTAALVLMGVCAAIYGIALARRALRRTHDEPAPAGRIFHVRQALLFTVAITVIMWLSSWLAEKLGTWGAVGGIAMGGFADAHSAAASAAALARQGTMTLRLAGFAVVAAVATNTATKLVLAAMAGGRGFARQLAPALLLMVAALCAGTWFAGYLAGPA